MNTHCRKALRFSDLPFNYNLTITVGRIRNASEKNVENITSILKLYPTQLLKPLKLNNGLCHSIGCFYGFGTGLEITLRDD